MKQANIRCVGDELSAWKAKAGKGGVSAWLRKLANTEANHPHVEIKRGRPNKAQANEPVSA